MVRGFLHLERTLSLKLDQKGREDLDDVFERFLTRANEVVERSRARRARSGEPAKNMILTVDRGSWRIAIVAVDGPPSPSSD